MTPRRLLPAILLVIFVLRHDLWWWHSGERLLGLPVGLAWHLLLCFAVAVTMAAFARVDDPGESGDAGSPG